MVLIFCLSLHNLFAAMPDDTMPDIKAKAIVLEKWQSENNRDSVFLWPFSFAEGDAQMELALKMLGNQYVTKIQLVYTRFAYQKGFDQKALNQQRMQKLFVLHPEWFGPGSRIVWEYVEQTGCNTAAGCRDYFHGFAFYFVSKAKMMAFYKAELNKKRKIPEREQEIGAFHYWFGQLINADKRFTPEREDTSNTNEAASAMVDTSDNDETTATLEQRAESFIEKVDAAAPVKSAADGTEHSDRKAPRKTESNRKGEEKAEKKEDVKTKSEEKKSGSGNGAFASSGKHTSSVSKRKRRNSDILDLYMRTVYPKNSAEKPKMNLSQYVLSLMKKRIEKRYLMRFDFGGYDFGCDTGPPCYDCIPPDSIGCKICYYRRKQVISPPEFDGTVTAVMRRFEGLYGRMNVTADVTSGMLQPVMELFVWGNVNENIARINTALFYNDGDSIPDTQKMVDSTGGLYGTFVYDFPQLSSFTLFKAKDRMFTAACHAIDGGDGGDVPENALEAEKKGIRYCSICDAYILIADNRSPIRDVSLLQQIKHPLRIILPFVIKEDGLINTEYLDVARATHGSIHTKTNDYWNLDTMKEGEILKVLEYKYALVKGKFICIAMP
jgi:hypothetical protein